MPFEHSDERYTQSSPKRVKVGGQKYIVCVAEYILGRRSRCKADERRHNQGNEKKRIAIGFGSGESELKVAVEGFEVTAHGMRKLGSGDTDSTGAKTPGVGFGALTTIITHNPLGLIVSAGMHTYGEETGGSKIEGRAKQTAKEIADILKKRFQEQGWI